MTAYFFFCVHKKSSAHKSHTKVLLFTFNSIYANRFVKGIFHINVEISTLYSFFHCHSNCYCGTYHRVVSQLFFCFFIVTTKYFPTPKSIGISIFKAIVIFNLLF